METQQDVCSTADQLSAVHAKLKELESRQSSDERIQKRDRWLKLAPIVISLMALGATALIGWFSVGESRRNRAIAERHLELRERELVVRPELYWEWVPHRRTTSGFDPRWMRFDRLGALQPMPDRLIFRILNPGGPLAIDSIVIRVPRLGGDPPLPPFEGGRADEGVTVAVRYGQTGGIAHRDHYIVYDEHELMRYESGLAPVTTAPQAISFPYEVPAREGALLSMAVRTPLNDGLMLITTTDGQIFEFRLPLPPGEVPRDWCFDEPPDATAGAVQIPRLRALPTE